MFRLVKGQCLFFVFSLIRFSQNLLKSHVCSIFLTILIYDPLQIIVPVEELRSISALWLGELPYNFLWVFMNYLGLPDLSWLKCQQHLELMVDHKYSALNEMNHKRLVWQFHGAEGVFLFKLCKVISSLWSIRRLCFVVKFEMYWEVCIFLNWELS